jgi:hypothetical protein
MTVMTCSEALSFIKNVFIPNRRHCAAKQAIPTRKTRNTFDGGADFYYNLLIS